MEDNVRRYNGFLPGRFAIDAYGDGGFRFGGMSHRGSILALPSGIYIWDVATPADINIDVFSVVLKEADAIEFLYIGTGDHLVPVSSEIKKLISSSGIRVLEIMQTGSAARTYNILAAENRKVAAALIAVD